MKKALAIILAWSIMTPMFVLSIASVSADSNSLLWGNTMGTTQTGSGLGNVDPRTTVANVIKVILGFLGIIAVIIVLLGGFQYMMAGGDEGKVEEAVGRIKTGIIGLVIILSAYGIAIFVTNAVYNVTASSS